LITSSSDRIETSLDLGFWCFSPHSTLMTLLAFPWMLCLCVWLGVGQDTPSVLLVLPFYLGFACDRAVELPLLARLPIW
jgi:hypothetical protein